MMMMLKNVSYVNLSLYVLVLAYILFINLNVDHKMTFLRTLMANPLFKVIVLGVIAISAFEMFKCCDFTLAILLTIAFLNTTMILNKNTVNEGFTSVYNRLRENFEDKEEDQDQDQDAIVNKLNKKQEEEDEEQAQAEMEAKASEEEEEEPKEEEEAKKSEEEEDEEDKEEFLDFNGNKAGSCSPGLDSNAPFNPQPVNGDTFGAPY
jgi:Skp family chaperone for outer membrane proteins